MRYRIRDARSAVILGRLLVREYVRVPLERLREYEPRTYEHALRVGLLAIDLALEYDLPMQVVELVGCAALLHDIGKLHVPRAVLVEARRPTKREWASLQSHPRMGYNMLRGKAPELVPEMVAMHHEFTKKPYPRSLPTRRDMPRYPLTERRRRLDISPWAQIIAACDIYDAMCFGRAYHPGRLGRAAIESEMRTEFRGSQTLIDKLLDRYPAED